jgi:hypothetical protein
MAAYLRLSTHPAVFAQPLSLERASANVENLIEQPHVPLRWHQRARPVRRSLS